MNYYEILQVSQNASVEVINAAYKSLVKKYHPDNYQGNTKDIEEILKKINVAHDTLVDPIKRSHYDQTLSINVSNKTYQNYGYSKDSERKNQENKGYEEDKKSEETDEIQHEEQQGRLLKYVVMGAVIITCILLAAEVLKNEGGQIDELELITSYNNQDVILEEENAKDISYDINHQEENVKEISKDINHQEENVKEISKDINHQEENVKDISNDINHQDDENMELTPTIEANNNSLNQNTFGLGDDNNQVTLVMGTPDRVDHYELFKDIWYYGDGYNASKIEFDFNGYVTGWDNKGDLRINIGQAIENAKPIGLRSSVQEVIEAHGTPDRVDHYELFKDIWYYGDGYNASKIEFDFNGYVTGWDNKGDLRINIGQAIENAKPIGLRSSVQEVIEAHGTPDRVDHYELFKDIWYYGDGYNASKIEFDFNGYVTGWDNKGDLRINIGQAIENAKPIGLRSSVQEVIEAHGTPDRVDHYELFKDIWYYGDGYNASKIEFDFNGYVIGWDNKGNLKIK